MVLAMSTTGWVIVGILAVCIWAAWRFGAARRGRKGHSFMGFFLLSLLFFPLAIILAVHGRRSNSPLVAELDHAHHDLGAARSCSSIATVGCAIALGMFRSDVTCRASGGGRAGHGVWVSDVFAFRGSPAAWQESLLDAKSVNCRCQPKMKPRNSDGLMKLPL